MAIKILDKLTHEPKQMIAKGHLPSPQWGTSFYEVALDFHSLVNSIQTCTRPEVLLFWPTFIWQLFLETNFVFRRQQTEFLFIQKYLSNESRSKYQKTSCTGLIGSHLFFLFSSNHRGIKMYIQNYFSLIVVIWTRDDSNWVGVTCMLKVNNSSMSKPIKGATVL